MKFERGRKPILIAEGSDSTFLTIINSMQCSHIDYVKAIETRLRISFLMSSLKRDCREVFVRIATHVGHMVLCCPIT